MFLLVVGAALRTQQMSKGCFEFSKRTPNTLTLFFLFLLCLLHQLASSFLQTKIKQDPSKRYSDLWERHFGSVMIGR